MHTHMPTKTARSPEDKERLAPMYGPPCPAQPSPRSPVELHARVDAGQQHALEGQHVVHPAPRLLLAHQAQLAVGRAQHQDAALRGWEGG